MKATNFSAGDLRGTTFDFQNGEGLPLHDHTKETAHILIVRRGSVRLSGPTIKTESLGPGDMRDLVAGHPHAIIAQEDKTKITNIMKHFPFTVAG